MNPFATMVQVLHHKNKPLANFKEFAELLSTKTVKGTNHFSIIMDLSIGQQFVRRYYTVLNVGLQRGDMSSN